MYAPIHHLVTDYSVRGCVCVFVFMERVQISNIKFEGFDNPLWKVIPRSWLLSFTTVCLSFLWMFAFTSGANVKVVYYLLTINSPAELHWIYAMSVLGSLQRVWMHRGRIPEQMPFCQLTFWDSFRFLSKCRTQRDVRFLSGCFSFKESVHTNPPPTK